MALRFGQTLFGAVSGVVTAAGFAACLASAQGQMAVIKHVSGAPAEPTAQLQGTAYRTRKIPVLTAQVSATGSGNAKADWLVAGTAQAEALGYGRGTAEFFGAGTADVVCTTEGYPYRLVKLYPLHAKSTATLSGEAYVFELLYGMPARATATLYGTTYHLAYGTAVASASATGQLTWHAGAKGEAQATAEGNGAAVYTLAVYGIEAQVEAQARAEEAITKAGVRYQELYGEASCEVVALNTHMAIYPSVTAWVSAQATAQAHYILGTAGNGQASCSISGTVIASATAVTLVQGSTSITATGRIRAWHKFKGEAQVQAQGDGTPLVTETGVSGTGTVQASGSGTVQVRDTKAYPDDGYGVALLQGQMNRVRTVSGAPVGVFGYAQAQMQKIHIAYGVAYSVSTLAGSQFRTRLMGGAAQGNSTGQLLNVQLNLQGVPAAATASLSGQIQRDQYLTGEALGTATSAVGIQVNDAARAPASRVVQVLAEARTVIVAEESRTIVV